MQQLIMHHLMKLVLEQLPIPRVHIKDYIKYSSLPSKLWATKIS